MREREGERELTVPSVGAADALSAKFYRLSCCHHWLFCSCHFSAALRSLHFSLFLIPLSLPRSTFHLPRSLWLTGLNANCKCANSVGSISTFSISKVFRCVALTLLLFLLLLSLLLLVFCRLCSPSIHQNCISIIRHVVPACVSLHEFKNHKLHKCFFYQSKAETLQTRLDID